MSPSDEEGEHPAGFLEPALIPVQHSSRHCYKRDQAKGQGGGEGVCVINKERYLVVFKHRRHLQG